MRTSAGRSIREISSLQLITRRLAISLAAALVIGGCSDVDGSAGLVGAPASAQPSSVGSSVPIDPRKLPPPANTPLPSPTGWPARTPEEVAQNVVRDPFVARWLQGWSASDPTGRASPRLGMPTYVKGYPADGYSPALPDVWLIPVLSGDRAIAVFAAAVMPGGNAAAGFYSGFEGSFPHPLSRAEAMAQVSTLSDTAVAAELMWSNLGTRQGLLVGLSEPFWRVVTSTRSDVLVLHDGSVIPANELR